MGIIKVFEGGGKSSQQDALELCGAIKAAVYEYDGKMNLCTVIGVLEIAKLEIIDEQTS